MKQPACLLILRLLDFCSPATILDRQNYSGVIREYRPLDSFTFGHKNISESRSSWKPLDWLLPIDPLRLNKSRAEHTWSFNVRLHSLPIHRILDVLHVVLKVCRLAQLRHTGRGQQGASSHSTEFEPSAPYIYFKNLVAVYLARLGVMNYVSLSVMS